MRDPPFTQDDIIALPRLRLAFELECCSSRDVCRLLNSPSLRGSPRRGRGSSERRGRGPLCFTSTLAKSRFSESESSLFELSRALAISPLKAMCGLTSQVLAKDFKTGFRLISMASFVPTSEMQVHLQFHCECSRNSRCHLLTMQSYCFCFLRCRRVIKSDKE